MFHLLTGQRVSTLVRVATYLQVWGVYGPSDRPVAGRTQCDCGKVIAFGGSECQI